jgi:hypothetical protein
MPFDNPFSRSLGITHLPASERCACPRASRQSRERCRGNLISIAGFFHFSKSGPVHTPYTPPRGADAGRSLPSSVAPRNPGNGTRVSGKGGPGLADLPGRKALCGAVAELASTSTKHPQKIQKWVSPMKKGGKGYGNKEITAGGSANLKKEVIATNSITGPIPNSPEYQFNCNYPNWQTIAHHSTSSKSSGLPAIVWARARLWLRFCTALSFSDFLLRFSIVHRYTR